MENRSNKFNILIIFGTVLLILLLVLIFTKAFGVLDSGAEEGAPAPQQEEQTPDAVSPSPDETEPPVDEPVEPEPAVTDPEPIVYDDSELVDYSGPVEHLFFHPVVAYPELSFDGDYQANGIDDWMVTATEYQKILESIYANDYVLVNIETLYTETTKEDGTAVMVQKDLRLPEGKKPLIISFDDVNYYDYMRENGFVYKLIVDENNQICSWGLDPDGNEVVSRDLDVVTILDKFVDEHPDFSFNGARASIGLTGFAGVLGYRTQRDSPNRESEIEAAKPVIERLKQKGFTFVSHSYAHFDMSAASYDKIVDDTDKWLDEVASLVGDTTVLLYPYGGRVDENDGAAFKYLQSKGFRYFCSVGVEPYVNNHSNSPAVCSDRMHPDGTTLRWNRSRYLRFYDAAEIMELDVRPQREYDFSA